MVERVVLHVGAMKSGTSYVQSLLGQNREVLSGRGVVFPGSRWLDQVAGVSQVLERRRVAVRPEPGAWRRLVDEACASEHVAVISMEFLGPVGVRRIATVVEAFPAGTVEVVVTGRDLGRQVPAMWQESVKNGSVVGFDDYVELVRRDEDGPGRTFWREQALGAMCARWGEVAGADRVHLVTVPPPGAAPDLLWRRFAEVLDVDPDGVELPRRANASLGTGTVETLRRLNEHLTDLSFAEYAPVVKHLLAKRVLGSSDLPDDPIGFDVPDWLSAAADRMRGRLAAMGVQVHGHLDELEPVAVPGRPPSSVPEAQVAAAAVVALEGAVRALVARAAAG